jgi:hypothetical protein
MTKANKPAKPVSPDAIARLADKGADVSGFFKGRSRIVQPIQRLPGSPFAAFFAIRVRVRPAGSERKVT